MKIIYTLFFLLLTGCILTHSELSLYYARTGLTLWFDKMIPTLLPFMILSGIMVRLQLTESFTAIVYPVIKPLYRVSRNVCYAMLMGFLCGFPMGAKTVSDLYSRHMISKKEAEFLLAFVNNIGPVYFVSFVLPLLQRRLILPYLIGMYGIPLLYGFVLRHTLYRDISPVESILFLSVQKQHIKPELTATHNQSDEKFGIQLLNAVDEAIISSVQSILSLGGYMILFNLLNLLPHILLGKEPLILAPLLEISGGLNLLQNKAPLYTLLMLSFGGISCIAQTNSCIKNTDLSIADYILHKLVLTVLIALYYLLWFLIFPTSFMR